MVKPRTRLQIAASAARHVGTYALGQLVKYGAKRAVQGTGRIVGGVVRKIGRGPKGNKSGRGKVISIAAHGAASRSIFKYRYGRRRKGRKNSSFGTHTLTSTESGRVNTGAGRQSNESKVVLFSKGQLESLELEFGDGTTDTAQYLVLRPSSVTHQITNQSQATVQFYIYDYVCRNNTDTLPNLHYWNDLRDQYDTTNDWANVVPNKPFQSPTLKYYWKLKRYTKLILEPGAVHEHIIVCNANAKLYEGAWRNAPAYIAGISCATIVQHHGFPVNDATTTTNVSLCPASYDYMSFYKLNCALVESRYKRLVNVGSLPSTTITPRTIMLEGGDVENVDQA